MGADQVFQIRDRLCKVMAFKSYDDKIEGMGGLIRVNDGN
jgi:hypothetical protein